MDDDGEPVQPKLDKIQLQIYNAQAEGDKKTVYELKQIHTDMKNSAKSMVDLNSKILLFLDNPTPQTYEMLKPILSHDKKEILYKTTKSDGSLSVNETIIRGWPAVIMCSAKNEAKNEVWEEIATRFFIVSPNTNVSKYFAANRLTSQKTGTPSWASAIYDNPEDRKFARFYIYRLKDSLESLCKDGENAVFNPFAEILSKKFPYNQGVTMRHFKRLMSFCNLETLINANTLMKIEFTPYHGEKKTSVITCLQTIKDAIKIIGRVSTVPPEKIKFYEEIFVPTIKEKTNVQTSIDGDPNQQKLPVQLSDNVTLTSAECAEKYINIFKKPITRKQISENYLKPLVDEGLIETIDNPENKSQKLYCLSSDLTIHNLSSVEKHLIDAVDTDFAYIWSCLARLGQVSTKFGKITRIFDSKNNTITYKEFQTKIVLGNSQNDNTLIKDSEKISGSISDSVDTYTKKRRPK